MIAYLFSFFLFIFLSLSNDTQCMRPAQNNENVEMNFLATDLHYLTLATENRLNLLRQNLQHNLALANQQRLQLGGQNLPYNPVTFDFTERCILLVEDTKLDQNKRLHYEASNLAVEALRAYFDNKNNGPIPAAFQIHCAFLKSLIYSREELPQELKDLPLLVSKLNFLLAQTRVANNPDADTATKRKLFH